MTHQLLRALYETGREWIRVCSPGYLGCSNDAEEAHADAIDAVRDAGIFVPLDEQTQQKRLAEALNTWPEEAYKLTEEASSASELKTPTSARPGAPARRIELALLRHQLNLADQAITALTAHVSPEQQRKHGSREAVRAYRLSLPHPLTGKVDNPPVAKAELLPGDDPPPLLPVTLWVEVYDGHYSALADPDPMRSRASARYIVTYSRHDTTNTARLIDKPPSFEPGDLPWWDQELTGGPWLPCTLKGLSPPAATSHLPEGHFAAQADPKSLTDPRAIAHRMATQDNACTAHPVFIVQQRKRIYGFDPYWVSDVTWVHDGDEWPEDDPDRQKAEAHYKEHHAEPDGWSRTGYRDTWTFVTACFTRVAADDYIAANRHNLTDPRVYVESAHRNPEWQAVVALLRRFGDQDVPLPGPAPVSEPPSHGGPQLKVGDRVRIASTLAHGRFSAEDAAPRAACAGKLGTVNRVGRTGVIIGPPDESLRTYWIDVDDSDVQTHDGYAYIPFLAEELTPEDGDV